MVDYKKPYYKLCACLSDVASAIEEMNYGQARHLILRAQEQAEELLHAEQNHGE